MRYSSLLLDVDGTLVPVGPHTVPSFRVAEALKQAKQKVTISIVSGRPVNWLRELFQTLDLEHPCIINGGSQIIDPRTEVIIWERPIDQIDIDHIFQIIEEQGLSFLINDNGVEYKNVAQRSFEKPLALQLTRFESKEQSDECMKILGGIGGISAHKFISWDKNRNYKQEIYITNKEGTKRCAALELARILNIHPKTMIGVGDSRNDIPLLDVCGLKIAMGNADEKLKTIAHYLAPSVDDDGVADVVERFILGDVEAELAKANISFLHKIKSYFSTF